jgi:hypothetical protein
MDRRIWFGFHPFWIVLFAWFASGCAGIDSAALSGRASDFAVEGLIDPDSGLPDPGVLRRTFAPIQRLSMSANFRIDSGRWSSARELNVDFFTDERDRVRMVGREADDGAIFFDLMAYEGQLAVYVPRVETLFTGETPEGGTAFSQFLGFEPQELSPFLMVGQRLAVQDFYSIPGPEILKLLPVESGSSGHVLSSIELSNQTGLPIKAAWRRDEVEWESHYLDWDYFADAESPGRMALMPTHLAVVNAASGLMVEIRSRPQIPQYTINSPFDQDLISLPTPSQPRVESLENLGSVIKEK